MSFELDASFNGVGRTNIVSGINAIDMGDNAQIMLDMDVVADGGLAIDNIIKVFVSTDNNYTIMQPDALSFSLASESIFSSTFE
jgi:hypothetical protein